MELLKGKDSTHLWLIGALAIAFIIRIVAAINLSVMADDMHFVTHAINFISSDRLLTYDQSSGLWFAFTDLVYHLLGKTQLASRMAAVLFGTASVLSIFLLVREFADKRIALVAAFLLALAPFHLKSTMAEMDVMAMFFVLSSLFFFVRAMRTDLYRYFIFSGISLGLAIYTKVYPLLFIPAILIYAICSRKLDKKPLLSLAIIKKILLFLAIVFLFCIPALAHNILLYQSKGFMDLQFTRTFGLGENISKQYYGFDPIFGEKNDWRALVLGGENKHDLSGRPLFIVALGYAWLTDPVMVLAGLAGLVLTFVLKPGTLSRRYFILALAILLCLTPFLASIIHLTKHYLFLELILIPPAALAYNELARLFSRIVKRDTLPLVVILYTLAMFIFIALPSHGASAHVYGKSYIAQVIDYKYDYIPENALIVADGRFYRGQINWMLQDRPYLEGTEFIEAINQQDSLPGTKVPTKVYYLECVVDDCGWGTIAGQSDFNQTMEQLTSLFASQARLDKTITSPSGSKSYFPLISSKNEIETVRVYSTSIPINPVIISIAKQPREWFLYEIGYSQPELQFDAYQTNGISAKLLDLVAHIVRWIALLGTFMVPIILIWYTFNPNKKISF